MGSLGRKRKLLPGGGRGRGGESTSGYASSIAKAWPTVFDSSTFT